MNGYDFYYQPTEAIISNPRYDARLKIGEECEILKLTPDYFGIWDIISYYSEKLSVLDNAINMSLINNKFAFLLGARNKAAGEALKKMLDKRSDYIEQNITNAETKSKEAEVNFKQSEEAIIASRKQANELLIQAKSSAMEEKERILEEARQESLQIKKNAEADIERSKEEAKESIRQEMVQVALEASKELLKREVNSKDNERLVEDFIKGIDA